MLVSRRPRLTTKEQGYGHQHVQRRRQLEPFVLAGNVACARCGLPILPGQAWDLGHVDGDRGKYAGPEHRFSSDCPEGGNRATSGRHRFVVELEPEPAGIAQSDPCWRVPWLTGLRRVPRDATWPRLMTVPHPRAAGSLGREFAAFAEERSGRPLRWWQRLVATRALEVDAAGELVWNQVVLSTARQVGKSWLLRELMLWRIHQGDRFGEPQDVMHTGKDLAVCKEIQRPARIWAKHRDGYRVREVNGQEEIEVEQDGSRWMLRAKEAVYGYSVSFGLADEAWKVKASSVDEGLTPTMVERAQPQLWLVSTAHRMATPLVLRERKVALDDLGSGGQDTLLVEWSAPAGVDLDDEAAWRAASPSWTPQRHRLVGRRLEAARANESLDADEPDPVEAFKAQWLNQWPRVPVAAGEALLPDGLWDELGAAVSSTGPIWVAIEDDFGVGAGVGAAGRLDDGRLEVAGWHFDEWNQAVEWVALLGLGRPVKRLLVGASMFDRIPSGTAPRPAPAASKETRAGLAVFRDLAITGRLFHDIDAPTDLDQAVEQAKVREAPAGLQLVARGRSHVVKATCWAVGAAHKPSKTPAIR